MIYSLDPIAMDGPITKLNELFFLTVINEICDFYLGNRVLVEGGKDKYMHSFLGEISRNMFTKKKNLEWGE